MITPGYWINPSGSILDISASTHVAAIINDPKRFGLTSQMITDAYEKYHEPLYLEGKARRELIEKTVLNGFIRIRLYPNRYWSITMDTLTDDVRNSLSVWSKDAAENRFSGPYMDVRVLELSTDKITTVPLIEL